LGFFIGLYVLATKFDWLKAKGRVALGLETLAFSLAWLFGDFLLVYYFSRGAINIFQNVWGSALSGPLIAITDSIGNANLPLHYSHKPELLVKPPGRAKPVQRP